MISGNKDRRAKTSFPYLLCYVCMYVFFIYKTLIVWVSAWRGKKKKERKKKAKTGPKFDLEFNCIFRWRMVT
jgi:hypothetical protein